jgi:hypothetical protein
MARKHFLTVAARARYPSPAATQQQTTTDALGAAGGVIAMGGAMVLGGLALATSTDSSPIAILGVGLALAGVPTASLATWYVATLRGLDVRVRAAYLLAVIALGLGAIAGGSMIVLGNGETPKATPAPIASGRQRNSRTASTHAKTERMPCEHFRRHLNPQPTNNNGGTNGHS